MEFDILYTLKLIIIGLVQGFTEPIPVSSSGHVMIASEILGVGEQGFTFAILTNTASLLAILFIYRSDIMRLVTGFLKYIQTREMRYKSDFNFALCVIIASIPAGVLGVVLSDVIAESVSMNVIAAMLLVTGVALWLIRNLKGRKGDKDITKKDAILVGFGQAVALTPGISRSGATVITAIATGMRQDTALRFSFMMYIPVSFGGVVLGLTDFLNESNKGDLAIPYIAAFIATLLMTYFAMRWFMGIMQKGKLHYFTYYCFTVAALLFIFF